MHSKTLLTVALLISTLILSCGKKETTSANASSRGGAPPSSSVTGIVVKPQKLANVVRTSGTIMAFEEVELHPEATGRITNIYFTEGSKVKKGDLLVKIYDEDLQAQLRKNESQVKLLKEQVARQEALLKIKATSQQEFDIVSNQLSSVLADQEVINTAIRKTEIRAPFSGSIGLRYVNVGSYVTPQSQIASIQNIDPVKIDFSIPEKYAGMVKKNDVVQFTNEAADMQFQGKVYAIEPRIDAATRMLQIRAISENTGNKILPGAFVKVELKLKETENALLIPTQAVIPVLKGQNVYIYKNGIAKQVPVKTGLRTAKEIEITEGLQAGDTIIISGIMSLRPDAPVKINVQS